MRYVDDRLIGAYLLGGSRTDRAAGLISVDRYSIRAESVDGSVWSEWRSCEFDHCTVHGLPIMELAASFRGFAHSAIGSVWHMTHEFTRCDREAR